METQTDTQMQNPSPTQTAEPRARRLQARSHAERIARAEATLRRVRAESELNTRLASQGFNAERLAEGEALCRAAQEAFTARQLALGAQRQAVSAANAAEENARKSFADFRVRVRSAIRTPAIRTLLDLDAQTPYDISGFLYMAQNTYITAQRMPALQTMLQETGYGGDALNALLAELENLHTTLQAADEARVVAVRATHERQRAMAALDRWIAILRAASRPVTRGRPDLKMQMGM